MKCRRIRHLLLDFVDGLGNESLHAEVDRHLSECSECERFAAETRGSLALLRRVTAEPLDENFNWKVRLAIHREQRASSKSATSTGAWVKAWNFRYVASTGVAFALVLGVGIVAVNQVGPNEPSSSTANRYTAQPSTPTRGEVVQNRVTRPSPGEPVGPRRVNYGDEPVTTIVEPGTRDPVGRFAREGAIGSVIDAGRVRMTPEMRMRCIQRQIHRLQSQLEKQNAPAQRP